MFFNKYFIRLTPNSLLTNNNNSSNDMLSKANIIIKKQVINH